MNKIFQIFLFLSFWMTSCISQSPHYAAIQDGVRCPLPKQLASSKPNQSERAPASESKKTSEYICDQLFSQ